MTSAHSDWLTIEPSRLAVVQLARSAEHLSLAERDPYRLLDALRCLHLAMVAVMTEALTGSTPEGALTTKSAGRVRALLESRQGGISFKEETMSYGALLEAVQQQGRLEWSRGPLNLSSHQLEQARSLDGFRGMVDHPKPTTWNVSKRDLQNVLVDVAPLVRHLMDSAPQRFTAADRQTADNAVTLILAAPGQGDR